MVALSARDLGASVAVAALIVTLIGLGSLVLQPARLAHHPEVRRTLGHRGRRRRRALALAAAAVSLAVPGGLWLLAAAMVVVGMAASVFSLARQKYLTEAVPVVVPGPGALHAGRREPDRRSSSGRSSARR